MGKKNLLHKQRKIPFSPLIKRYRSKEIFGSCVCVCLVLNMRKLYVRKFVCVGRYMCLCMCVVFQAFFQFGFIFFFSNSKLLFVLFFFSMRILYRFLLCCCNIRIQNKINAIEMFVWFCCFLLMILGEDREKWVSEWKIKLSPNIPFVAVGHVSNPPRSVQYSLSNRSRQRWRTWFASVWLWFSIGVRFSLLARRRSTAISWLLVASSFCLCRVFLCFFLFVVWYQCMYIDSIVYCGERHSFFFFHFVSKCNLLPQPHRRVGPITTTTTMPRGNCFFYFVCCRGPPEHSSSVFTQTNKKLDAYSRYGRSKGENRLDVVWMNAQGMHRIKVDEKRKSVEERGRKRENEKKILLENCDHTK